MSNKNPTIVVNPRKLVEAVKAAMVIAPRDDVRYFLNGVCIHRKKHGVAVTASDGIRMVTQTLPDESDGMSDDKNSGNNDTDFEAIISTPPVERTQYIEQTPFKQENTREFVKLMEGVKDKYVFLTIETDFSPINKDFDRALLTWTNSQKELPKRSLTNEKIVVEPNRFLLVDGYFPNVQRIFNCVDWKEKFFGHKTDLIEQCNRIHKEYIAEKIPTGKDRTVWLNGRNPIRFERTSKSRRRGTPVSTPFHSGHVETCQEREDYFTATRQ